MARVVLRVPGRPRGAGDQQRQRARAARARALRPSVAFRRVTHGFRSTWGADGHALVRSAIDTARLGGVRPLDAIRRALQGCPALPA